MDFGRRLKRILAERDISQREIGRLLGVTEAAVSNWVMGRSRPSLDLLQVMADRLDTTVDYLLGRTDEPKGLVKTEFPEDWTKVVKILADAGLSPADIEHAVGVLQELKKMREG